MKALITINFVVLMVVISVTQASKGMHNKLEFFFFFSFACFCICLFALFLCLFVFFLQLKMNIKKNNNLCPETKKQLNK